MSLLNQHLTSLANGLLSIGIAIYTVTIIAPFLVMADLYFVDEVAFTKLVNDTSDFWLCMLCGGIIALIVSVLMGFVVYLPLSLAFRKVITGKYALLILVLFLAIGMGAAYFAYSGGVMSDIIRDTHHLPKAAERSLLVATLTSFSLGVYTLFFVFRFNLTQE